MTRRPPAPGGAACALAAALVLVTAGCGEEQSTLDPASHQAGLIADLWWGMLIGACILFGSSVGMIGFAVLWRRRRGFPLFGEREPLANGLVVAFGIAIPAVVLSGLFAVSNLGILQRTDAAPGSTAMTIEITGHQWFWEVRYPGTAAVTANEIHIPARTRVDVVVKTADVIHSVWVPALNKKVDAIPGHENHLLWYADRPGRYRGQCAEFCGLQHAHMGMVVFAQPRDAFEAWLRTESQSAAEPAGNLARAGRATFLSHQCAACHTIRGTPADGDVGPDLTHVGSRTTLAALTIPNTEGNLAGWILDPQHVKPGAVMPATDLRGPELQGLVAYLEGLK